MTAKLTAPEVDLRIRSHEQMVERHLGQGCWQNMAHSREAAVAQGVRIPEWCLFPIAAGQAVAGVDNDTTDADRVFLASILTGLSNWRPGRGVYVFDNDFAKVLDESDGLDTVDAEIFTQLPEWGMWIECPSVSGRPIHNAPEGTESVTYGAFVWVEFDVNTGGRELRILRDMDINGSPSLLGSVVHLGSGSIADGIDAGHQQSLTNIGVPNHGAPIAERIEQYAASLGMDYDAAAINEWHRETADFVYRIVARVAYLVSRKPDVDLAVADITPTRAAAARWQKAKVHPLKVWEVGYRIVRDIERSCYSPDLHDGDSGPSVRPHIRRAHWHTYRTGVGRTNRELRFIAPTVVGLGEAPTVIREHSRKT